MSERELVWKKSQPKLEDVFIHRDAERGGAA